MWISDRGLRNEMEKEDNKLWISEAGIKSRKRR